MIERLSYITAAKIVGDNNLEHIVKVLSERKNKEITLTKEEAIEVIAYSLQTIYGELFKILILFIVSYLFNVILPTFIIMIVFSTLRLFAGGEHMDTVFKCFITMFVLFLSGGLLVKNLINYDFALNIFLILTTYIIGFILIVKYAPRDNLNKEIKDENEIKKFKKLSLVYITVITIIMLLLCKNNIIVLSMIYGILVELWTITPHGTKCFSYIKNINTK